MKLASYKSVSSGLSGLFDRIVKFRLKGQYSHNEIIFEPGDGVEKYMPDNSLEPDTNGAVWCASSSAIDRLPDYSPYRAGCLGGVRFKRIVIKDNNWDIIKLNKDPLKAALIFKANEGYGYDYELLLGFLVWLIPNQPNRMICSEICGKALGYEEPWRFDPCLLHNVELANNVSVSL